MERSKVKQGGKLDSGGESLRERPLQETEQNSPGKTLLRPLYCEGVRIPYINSREHRL